VPESPQFKKVFYEKVDDVEIYYQEVLDPRGLFNPRWRCPILRTADRLVALLGRPALETLYDVLGVYEEWSHSRQQEIANIFWSRYVQATWRQALEWHRVIPDIPEIPPQWEPKDLVPRVKIGIPYPVPFPHTPRV